MPHVVFTAFGAAIIGAVLGMALGSVIGEPWLELCAGALIGGALGFVS